MQFSLGSQHGSVRNRGVPHYSPVVSCFWWCLLLGNTRELRCRGCFFCFGFLVVLYFIVWSIQRIYNLGNCILCGSCCRQVSLLFVRNTVNITVVLPSCWSLEREKEWRKSLCSPLIVTLKRQCKGESLQENYLLLKPFVLPWHCKRRGDLQSNLNFYFLFL